ncbi:hypothetical protein PC111_g10977 [Phytophthora cactorum]|nr:hypothetical protein PC112_g11517 [Phytophthora cactorum]KAG2821558.1 hypothetical protein PC111_g10977 [Phytophthora cactorum]
MKSVIQLPARFKSRNDKKEVKHEAPTTSTLRDKLQALRSKRVRGFFRAKARQRAGAQALASVVGSSSSAVLSFLRSLRRLALGFFSRKREQLTALLGGPSKWGRRLRTFFSSKSVKKMMQRTLGRGADKEQARIYQWMGRALARLGRSAIAAAHKRRRAEDVAILAQEIVDRVMKEAALKVAAIQERERLERHARVIQRLWRLVKSNEQAAIEAKSRLLDLLTNFPSRLREYQGTQRQWLSTVHETSASTVTYCIRRAAQRLAARLIQRTTGTAARGSWGVAGAFASGENPSQRAGNTTASTSRDDAIVFSSDSIPKTSTGTKLQCVPFSRFEKIIARGARVNLSNVWVAIPVGHQEVREVLRRGGLDPLLVGKGRRRQKGALQTTYDWVPAHLLQSKDERDAAASRRQRAASPAVSKTILEF